MINADFANLMADFRLNQWLTVGVWTRADKVADDLSPKMTELVTSGFKKGLLGAVIVATASITTTFLSRDLSPSNTETVVKSSEHVAHKSTDAATEIATLKSHIQSLHKQFSGNKPMSRDAETFHLAMQIAEHIEDETDKLPSKNWAEDLIKSQHIVEV